MANQLVPNRYDNAAQRGLAFPADVCSTSLVSRYLNVPLMNIENASYIYPIFSIYAAGRCKLEGWPGDMRGSVTALEVVAPNLPDNHFLLQDPARKKFILSILTYIVQKQFNSDYITVAPNIAGIPERAPFANLPDTAQQLMRNIAGHDVTDADYTVGLCTMLVNLLREGLNLSNTQSARNVNTRTYVLGYVSLAKRGMISNQKLRKVLDDVSNATGRQIDIEPREVSMFWGQFGSIVTVDNARNIITGLSHGIANFSLRLRLTLDQAVRSGMTCYWAIRTAVTRYPTFPWDQASRYIPDDFRNFQVALEMVGDNEYFGFGSNLGNASSTRYKNLSWLAIKLLIKCNAQEYGSFTEYRGLPARPDHSIELQALLDTFAPEVPAAGIEGLAEMIGAWRLVN